MRQAETRRLAFGLALLVLGVVAASVVSAARRHPGGGLPLDQLPPQVRSMRVEPAGSTPVDWQRGNVAFHDSLVAAGDTTGFLYAYAVEGLVEGLLSVQQVSTPEARALAWRALELKRAALGPEHAEIVRTLMNVALVEVYGFENDRLADSLMVLATGIQRRWHGPNHSEVARVLALRALVLQGMDDAGALALLDTTIALASAASPPDSFRILGALARRGSIRASQGYTEEHVSAQRQILEYNLRVGARNPLGVAISHGNLGLSLMEAGRPGEGLIELLRAREFLLHHLGPTHYEFRTGESSVGSTYYLLGDYGSARRHFEAALRRPPGENAERGDLFEPTVALGILEMDEGNLVRARELLEEGARGLRSHPDRSPVFATNALQHLAACLITLDRPDSALAVVDDVERIWRTHMPRCSDCRPPSLGMVEASAHLALGDTMRAVAALESTVVSVEAHPGRSAHFAWSARLGLARLAAARGRTQEAFDLALAVERRGRAGVSEGIETLPDRWALRQAALRQSGLALLTDLLDGGFESPGVHERVVLDEVIRSRALVLDRMAHRRSLAQRRARSEAAPLWHRWDTARRRLREFEEAGRALAEQDPDGRTHQALVRELDVAESDLAVQALAGQAAEGASDTIGVDAIARRLAPGDALVSYLRVRRNGLAPDRRKAPAEREPERYVAFVLRSGEPRVRMIPLTEATELDRAVADWLDAAGPARPGSADEGVDGAGQRLRSLVWDPLRHLLRGTGRVFVVPDASLGLVHLGALPATDGRFLVEEDREITMLACERDLAARATTGAPARRPVLGVGGVDYRAAKKDLESSVYASVEAIAEGASSSSAVYRGPRASCDQLRETKFESLPASITEIEELRARAAAVTPRVPFRQLRGPGASEAAFKAQAPGAGALHLATHGFLLDPACAGGFTAASRSRGFAGADDRAVIDNPLTRCGLALAGANRRAEAGPDEDDGLLTGDEIAALDLSGVEFVVLSACNTGLGDVLAGEGVLGLQRAFKIAGAGPVVMSLWPVEDQVARQWMRKFYEARLSPGVTTSEATRRASLAMLAERRRLGLSTRPSTWAPFVAVGVDR